MEFDLKKIWQLVAGTTPADEHELLVSEGIGPGQTKRYSLGQIKAHIWQFVQLQIANITQGPQGAAGATGAQGIQGLKGDPGLKGDKGDTGLKGDTGPTGGPGIQGPAGATGLKGDTGLQGVQGPVGAPGEQGVKGDTGDAGVQEYPSATDPALVPGANIRPSDRWFNTETGLITSRFQGTWVEIGWVQVQAGAAKSATILFSDFEANLVTVNNTAIKTIKSMVIRGIGTMIPGVDFTTLSTGGFTIIYPGFEAQADTAISIHYLES